MLRQDQYSGIRAWKITYKNPWGQTKRIIGKTGLVFSKVKFSIEFSVDLNYAIRSDLVIEKTILKGVAFLIQIKSVFHFVLEERDTKGRLYGKALELRKWDKL